MYIHSLQDWLILPIRRERHRHLLTHHWESAAALAWQGYDTLGRGALVVRKAIHAGHIPGIGGWLGTTPALYIPASWTPTRSDCIWETVTHIITNMAESYDPDREIVCIFLGLNDELSAYRMLGPILHVPPTAHRDGALFCSDTHSARPPQA